MAQDYWRGGWANIGQLPGTQAAMTSRNAGGAYGPLNALADILGAYWIRRDRDKANEEMDNYEAGLEGELNPAPQFGGFDVGSPYGQSVQEKTLGIQPGQFGSESWGQENINPIPKPLTLGQKADKARQFKAKFMRELQRKHPMADMAQMSQYIDEVTNGKILGYANDERDSLYNAMNEGVTLENLPALMKQADTYNAVAAQVGGAPVNLRDIVGMLGTKVANVDSGGKIIQQVAPANGLPFRNVPVADDQGNVVGYRPEYTRTAGIIPKSLSPAQIEQAKIAAAKQGQAQYNADRNYALSVAKAQMAQGNKDREYEQKQKYYDWKMENGGGGSKRKLTQAAEGALTGIAEMRQKALADISSGAALDEKNHSVREYMDAVNEAKEKGYISADEVTEANNSMMELQFYLAKRAGNEDYAALMASQMTPDYWKEYMQAQWGDQPQ